MATDGHDRQQQTGAKHILNHGQSSRTSDIGPTLTLKEGALFLLTDQSGEVPPQAGSSADSARGLGLYFHDMRHLDQATLRLNGAALTLLLAATDVGYRGVCELTNPELDLGHGDTLHKERIGLRWEKTLSDAVDERLTFQNFGHDAVELSLTLEYAAHFDSMFTVRGAEPGKRGTLRDPEATEDTLAFVYDGADGHRRTTTLRFTPPPTTLEGRRATYRLHLAPGASCDYTVNITVADHPPKGKRTRDLEAHPHPATPDKHEAERHADRGSFSGKVHVQTSDALFNRVLRRSFLDLAMLAMRQGDDAFYAAGVPWYVALFGRDSLVTALEMLAYEPDIARDTLVTLARYQGAKDDDFQDEEPGKILHELRVGEQANLREVPSIPYYGTIDATPLFLILLDEYLRWTGDLDFFRQLRAQVEAALGWLDHCAGRYRDGFLAYASKSHQGLANQGWKDSGNSIVNADGAIVTPPVALVEVQGYVYRARRGIAAVYRHSGDDARAEQLEGQADDLYRRFNERFWLAEQNNYALALQKDGVPAVVDASNQGQALWGGIVAAEKAGCVRDTLLDPARLFSGWGIRTISRGVAAYNPLDYQVGAVWPHDNALIVDGLRRYGFDAAALTVFTGIYQAATRFDHYRLPELFAGFGKDEYSTPVHYPVACSPQAWAAGSLPYMLQSLLGFAPDAVAHQLRVIRPCLPDWLAWVEVRGVRVGQGSVDLRYERSGGLTLVAVLRQRGDVRVTIEY
jgi:glycogen debranching enzyme